MLRCRVGMELETTPFSPFGAKSSKPRKNRPCKFVLVLHGFRRMIVLGEGMIEALVILCGAVLMGLRFKVLLVVPVVLATAVAIAALQPDVSAYSIARDILIAVILIQGGYLIGAVIRGFFTRQAKAERPSEAYRFKPKAVGSQDAAPFAASESEEADTQVSQTRRRRQA